MGVNTPIMEGYLAIAKKYHVQDVSYRAVAGRIKQVTGIDFKPTELFALWSEEDGVSVSDASYKKNAKFHKWVEKKVGEDVVLGIQSIARPHLRLLLELHLLGFIPEKVLTRKVKANTTMAREGGGVSNIDWSAIVEKIKLYQESKGKRKSLVKDCDLDKDTKYLSTWYSAIYAMAKLGLTFERANNGELHVAVLVDHPKTVTELENLGKMLLKSSRKKSKFSKQLAELVKDIDQNGQPQLYLCHELPSELSEESETLFSIDLDGKVYIASA